METAKTNCEHACRNTCATLERAIEKENELLEMFGNSLNECNMPDVHSLLNKAIENKKEAVGVLQQKLDEIKTNSLIDDDIEESYEGKDR
jgi:hypothetical protein